MLKVKMNSAASDKSLQQPVIQLEKNENDFASVEVTNGLLAGKIAPTEVKPENDEGEEEMNMFRENPQNDIKGKEAFKLHRAQKLLFKPQLFGGPIGPGSFKTKMYERTSTQVGKRLPVDNFRLNTIDFTLPITHLT